jgi:D-glycero-D-manno-heptose 1,7-bisphosphate phosphatase
VLKELHILRPLSPTPAVFFDRDGTLNVEKNYLYRHEDWEWEDGAISAVRQLQAAGYLIVILTNQSGIARGLYSSADVRKLHALVQLDLARNGAQIDAFYCCPHHPDFTGACLCRKPGTQMLLEAAQDLNVNMQLSWMVGDRISDLIPGLACGVKVALVRTGYGRDEERMIDALPNPVSICDTLAIAADTIIHGSNLLAP